MNTQAQSKGPVNAVMVAGVAGLVVSLGVALANLVSDGHASFNTASNGLTWGLPVVNYVFFVLTSTGLTFVASLAMVFGFKEFYPIAKRCIWVAVFTLVAGFLSLGMELGHPLRMVWAVPLAFQYMSPLNWMGVFYAAYLVLLLLKFQKVNANDWNSSASRKLGVTSFVVVVLAHGMLGGVFGAMAMRPMWYGPLVPLYFLMTAAATGAAFAVLITYLAYGGQANMPENVRSLMRGAMPKVFAATIAVILLATLSRTLIGLWSNADGLQVWKHIVGSAWFWVEVLALVAAFYMLLNPNTRNEGNVQLIAALLVIVSIFIGRYEFIIGGQLVPVFKGSWVRGLIEYTPSLTEWMLTLASTCVALTGWAFGEKMLNLAATPDEKA